jgi:hypothetical protein
VDTANDYFQIKHLLKESKTSSESATVLEEAQILELSKSELYLDWPST